MSWHDRAPLFALLLGLTGCQVQPLYAPAKVEAGDSTLSAMQSIEIETKTDRLGQALMNELVFALRGGAALSDPRYTLRLVATSRTAELAIEERAEVPTAKLVSLTTSYTLTENATGRAVTHGTVHTTASFDFSSQRFANLRAERDAENRAARLAAADVRTRLAMALSDER
jgi:LPS-assembly lipoprotein